MADIADLEDLTHELVEEHIEYRVVFPSEDSAVIAVEGPLNSSQLKLVVGMGAHVDQQGTFRILLVPDPEEV